MYKTWALAANSDPALTFEFLKVVSLNPAFWFRQSSSSTSYADLIRSWFCFGGFFLVVGVFLEEEYEVAFLFLSFITKSCVIWDKLKLRVDTVSTPMDKYDHHYSGCTGHIQIKDLSLHRGREHAYDCYPDMVSRTRKGGYLGTRALFWLQ